MSRMTIQHSVSSSSSGISSGASSPMPGSNSSPDKKRKSAVPLAAPGKKRVRVWQRQWKIINTLSGGELRILTWATDQPRHAKVFYCDLCDRSFSEPASVKKHKKAKHEVKNFACLFPNCGKAFGDAIRLQRHENLHGHGSTITPAVEEKSLPPQLTTPNAVPKVVGELHGIASLLSTP